MRFGEVKITNTPGFDRFFRTDLILNGVPKWFVTEFTEESDTADYMKDRWDEHFWHMEDYKKFCDDHKVKRWEQTDWYPDANLDHMYYRERNGKGRE